MANAMTIRKRSEIPVEDTWAVEDLYVSDEAWEAELNTLESDKKELTSFAGSLGQSGENLFAYLTKMEQVESRIKQTLRKKGGQLVFHWRGGGLNRTILAEILDIARAQAEAKGKAVACAVNASQSVIQLDFTDAAAAELTVQHPDENREDVPEMAEN